MAIPVYLWITDDAGNLVKGSVDIHGREGSIEIMELMHNIELPTDDKTGKITGKRLHGDYALIKEIDSSSPYLYQGVSSGLGDASDGCIILSLPYRKKMNSSTDKFLVVED